MRGLPSAVCRLANVPVTELVRSRTEVDGEHGEHEERYLGVRAPGGFHELHGRLQGFLVILDSLRDIMITPLWLGVCKVEGRDRQDGAHSVIRLQPALHNGYPPELFDPRVTR